MLKQLLTQAGRPSSKAPKDKFSLENLRYLYNQLVKYPVVDSSNANRIVEVLRSIAELMIWGDQHNPLFFDYFAEKNIITNFARIIAQKSAEPKVKTQVIQTLSILIQNTDSEQAVFYLLSNNYINDLIVSKFDFTDDDLLAHYISFLKTLSFKLNTRTILFFYNDKANDFPLYVEALKFFNHPESMVRAAVRTLSLNIYKVDDERMRRFIYDRTCLPYFCNLVWFLKDQTLSMSRLIEQPGGSAHHLEAGRDGGEHHRLHVLPAGHPLTQHRPHERHPHRSAALPLHSPRAHRITRGQVRPTEDGQSKDQQQTTGRGSSQQLHHTLHLVSSSLLLLLLLFLFLCPSVRCVGQAGGSGVLSPSARGHHPGSVGSVHACAGVSLLLSLRAHQLHRHCAPPPHPSGHL